MTIFTNSKTYHITLKIHKHPSMVISKITDTKYVIKAHKSIQKSKIKAFFLNHLNELDKLPGTFNYDDYLGQNILVFGQTEAHFPKDKNERIKRLKSRLIDEILILEKKYKTLQKEVDLKGLTYEIKYYKSRFGSCHPHQRIIRFNLILAHYDKRFLEYIYVHEIAHLNEQNHQAGFYQLMDTLLPNHRQLASDLKAIHAAFIKEHA